jgi:hypothetical protein
VYGKQKINKLPGMNSNKFLIYFYSMCSNISVSQCRIPKLLYFDKTFKIGKTVYVPLVTVGNNTAITTINTDFIITLMAIQEVVVKRNFPASLSGVDCHSPVQSNPQLLLYS